MQFAEIEAQREVFWENPQILPFAQVKQEIDPALIADAEARLQRFAPFIAQAFPETKEQGGVIESPLRKISAMGERLCCPGQLLLKMDSHLPISGSVKARGGIYEVLRHAEDLALKAGILTPDDDYAILAEPSFRSFFGKYKVQVGSTGNLGMSIGIMSAALGFETIVHMSSDAKEHPLFVYLPCGVGGAPGGICYGLKQIYGDAVQCFFVEPAASPCMLLGLATGEHENVSVQDYGLSGKTHADGLAVGRPSGLVCSAVKHLVSGIFTVRDAQLYDDMRLLKHSEDIFLEPSACAAFAGPRRIAATPFSPKAQQATHIAWATGGSMVPADVREAYLQTHLD